MPFIKIAKLTEIWGHGFIKLNKIDVDSKENRGRYVSKYFSKDIDLKNHKQKSFFKSQNLIKPQVERMTVPELLDFSNDDIVYTKTYNRKVPKFHKENDFENKITFENCAVRYTKIRKEEL